MREYRGVATVEELGFDLDKMMRFARMSMNPPTEDGKEEVVMPYMGGTYDEDGIITQAPLADEHEEWLLTRFCGAMGYKIDWNGWLASEE